MKHKWIKPLVLIAVFLISVAIFECAIAKGSVDLTTEWKEAELPVVFLSDNGKDINRLQGYQKEMNPLYIRDTITPISSKMELPIKVLSYDKKITGISYEIRSLDAGRLIEDNEVKDFKAKKGKIEASLAFPNILDEGVEYLLTVQLHSKDEMISYYTRVIKAESWNASKCIDFALNFHQASLDKKASDALAMYMESDHTTDNTTLENVSIKSTLNQVSWGSFVGKRQTDPKIQVVEITPAYSVIMLEYIMSSTGEKGELEYYNVEEYYRIRVSGTSSYLLDFNRNMEEIFRGENGNIVDKKLKLGIRNKNVEYLSNEHGTSFCFVQAGELWGYNVTNNAMAKIFSFRGFEGIDDRENSMNHRIRILKVSETGSTDFVVYGYMSRGSHEGEVGVCVYHYDSVANTLEEELWIPFSKSFEVIEDEVGKVMYVNKNNQFFMMVDGDIYQIDLNTRKKSILASGVGENWYAFSKGNSRIAWISKGDENTGTQIKLFDMEKEKEFVIDAKAGEFIRPTGFLKNDFIYGTAKKEQVITDGAGNTLFPMYKIGIINNKNKEIKQYEKPGYFVTGVTIDDYTIHLSRVSITNGSYVVAAEDTIMNQAGDTIYPVMSETFFTPIKQTQVQLIMGEAAKDETPKILTPKMVALDKARVVSLEKKETLTKYYAYAKGKVMMSSLDVSDAIRLADQYSGVVIDNQVRYVWKRARDNYQETIPGMTADLTKVGSDYKERCLSIMLKKEGINISVSELLSSGKTPKEILERSLQSETVLDLNGCSLQQILYYVNQGTPVYGIKNGNQPILIVGYSSSTYVIYDPATNATKAVPKAELETAVGNAGNVFLAYLKK